MAIDPELLARFQSLDDEELAARRLSGGLTQEASTALNAVLQQRGIDAIKAHELLRSDVGDDASQEATRLERARVQMRWLTATFVAALAFLPVSALIAAMIGPSDGKPVDADNTVVNIVLAVWFVLVVSFYVSIYRAAATLRYGAPWLLLLAVLVKVIGWIVVYAALVAEYRRQRTSQHPPR